MIDMHVIKHPLYDRNIVDVKHKKINLYKINGMLYHIGMSRCEGFKQGCSKYVSFFDDDDHIDENVIDLLLYRLENDPTISAIFTKEIIHYANKSILNHLPIADKTNIELRHLRYIHHLVIIRREVIKQYYDLLNQCPDLCEFTLYGQMLLDGHKIQYADVFGYHWFIHQHNAHTLKIKPSQISIDIINKSIQHEFDVAKLK